MNGTRSRPALWPWLTSVVLWGLAAGVGAAPGALPVPLSIDDVFAIAVRDRAEIAAAHARAEAVAERPAVAGALEDPVLSFSIDHYPFDMPGMAPTFGRYDWSFAVEQRVPLSRVRSHRVAAARAGARLATAQAEVTALDVGRGAQRDFLMLLERRRMAEVLAAQRALTQQLVDAAAGRYASGVGSQTDVLRAESELARVDALRSVLDGQLRAAVAMLNTSLGRGTDDPFPRLVEATDRTAPLPLQTLLDQAVARRPELVAGAAETEQAAAELAVMRSMNLPMGMLRMGRASTMAEGPGAMLMVGVSVPLWRDRQRAAVAEASAMRRMADADLEAMRRMVEGEVAATHAELEAARTRTMLLDTEVAPRSRAAAEAALASYAAGQGTLLAVMESARALWEVRAELVMAETALGLARVDLQRAVGTAEVR